MAERFTFPEAGVYADGAFGDMHTTSYAVDLAHRFGMVMSDEDELMMLDALTNNGEGIVEWDMHEEWRGLVDEAVDFLNERAVLQPAGGSLFFEFYEGDFRLTFEEEGDDA